MRVNALQPQELVLGRLVARDFAQSVGHDAVKEVALGFAVEGQVGDLLFPFALQELAVVGDLHLKLAVRLYTFLQARDHDVEFLRGVLVGLELVDGAVSTVVVAVDVDEAPLFFVSDSRKDDDEQCKQHDEPPSVANKLWHKDCVGSMKVI